MRTNRLSPYLFIAPFFLLFFAFSLFPMLFSMVTSFMEWDGVNSMKFVGIRNYIRIISQDKMFYKSLYNVFLFMGITIPLQLVTGLFLAVILNGTLKKIRGPFQLINFLPYLATPVAVGLIFQTLFDWKYGFVNFLLQKAGILAEPINWLGSVSGIRILIVFILWWKYFGYFMVVFAAGLSTIPESLYEAARIDGAKWHHVFFKITLPYLRPIMTFMVTMSIIGGFQMFDEPYVVFQQTSSRPLGGIDNTALTIVMNYYDTAFQRFNFGYGASIAYVLFIIIFVSSLVSTRLMREKDEI